MTCTFAGGREGPIREEYWLKSKSHVWWWLQVRMFPSVNLGKYCSKIHLNYIQSLLIPEQNPSQSLCFVPNCETCSNVYHMHRKTRCDGHLILKIWWEDFCSPSTSLGQDCSKFHHMHRETLILQAQWETNSSHHPTFSFGSDAFQLFRAINLGFCHLSRKFICIHIKLEQLNASTVHCRTVETHIRHSVQKFWRIIWQARGRHLKATF